MRSAMRLNCTFDVEVSIVVHGIPSELFTRFCPLLLRLRQPELSINTSTDGDRQVRDWQPLIQRKWSGLMSELGFLPECENDSNSYVDLALLPVKFYTLAQVRSGRGRRNAQS